MNKTALTILVALVFFSLVSSGLLLTYKIWQGRESVSGGIIPGQGLTTGQSGQFGRPVATQTASPSPISSLLLRVDSPADQSTVSNAKLTVKGKTVAGAEVFVNEKETVADSQGNFSLTLQLEEGENSIFITVTDEAGNLAEKEIIVTYAPPES